MSGRDSGSRYEQDRRARDHCSLLRRHGVADHVFGGCGMTEKNKLEAIAREHCARLLTSKAAQALPREQAEGLVILAFTLGAAWCLDCPDMIELANAQFDSLRSNQQ